MRISLLVFFLAAVAQVVGCMDAAGDLNLVKIEYRRGQVDDKKDKAGGAEEDVQTTSEILEEVINGLP